MKTIIVTILAICFMAPTTERTDSIYQYEMNTINGEKISLEEFEGDILLIVNTASQCGNTPQYEGLQEMHDEYSDRGFKVLGFPANNFGGQEPGSDKEILEFCETNFSVSFPLFSKISVEGEDIHPLFELLTESPNPDFTGPIGWNFEKFLIDRNGKLVRRFKTSVTPESKELQEAVQQLLGEEI